MGINANIIAELEAYGAMSAVVGRIYAERLPEQAAYPSVVFHVASENPINTMGIVEDGSAGRRNARYRFDVRAETVAQLESLVLALKGAMASASLFTSLCLTSNSWPYEYTSKAYRRVVDFSVWYVE